MNEYTQERREKDQNFFDEIAIVQQRIENSDEEQYRFRQLKPNLYEPVKTLWETLENKKTEETRGLFRKELEKSIELSQQIAEKLVSNTMKAVKMQPERKAELIIRDRDMYIKRLDDVYGPIDYWYQNAWNEQTKSVNHIGALEADIYLFCYQFNKPFFVGLRLLSDLYGYHLAISRFNELIEQTGSISDLSVQIADEEQIKLSHPEIAILYHINGWLITDNNADVIAQKYGQTSGQRLMTEYGNLSNKAVRTGVGKNRVKNYKRIEELILPKYKTQYYNELEESIMSNEKIKK